jgi:uncharacterized GH25 family protein
MRFALVVLILFQAPLSAHEIKVFSSRMLLPEPGKATIYLSWGHRLPVDELVDASPIERYEVLSPSGTSTALKNEGISLQANAINLKELGLHTAVIVRKPSIYTYVVNEDGERQLKRGAKTEHAGAKIESTSRYQQCGKSLIVVGKPGEEVAKQLGLPVEIVPLDAPTKWTTKSDLRFQILLRGKPVPTAAVEARDIGFKPDEAWSYATESNRKGEFVIRANRPGIWVVKVNVKSLIQGKLRDEFDFDALTATLSLEVRP